MQSLSTSVKEWLRTIKQAVDAGTGAIPWASVNKAGANLTDIPTRLHSSLQSIQGGDGSNAYHFTIALKGSKVFDFGSIAAGAQATTTVTVTGATTTCAVALGFSSTPETGIDFRAWVSAADTVTIQAINRTAGAIDPASRTYYLLIMDN